MLLSIISVNYKKPELTTNLLKSVYSLYEKEFREGIFEYIIVDNNSQDSSIEILQKQIKKYHGDVSLIKNNRNAGFGGGNNKGARFAKGTYLLFLNNDTTVADSSIATLVTFLDQNKQADIVGGLMKSPTGTHQQSASHFFSLWYILLIVLGAERFLGVHNPNQIQEVDWVKGGFFMIRKEVFDRLKGFDEGIFMYTEDMELCLRARKQGFHTFFYPDAFVFHKDQGSSNRSFAIVHIYKGILYMYKKHYPRWQYLLVQCILTIKAMVLLTLGKLLHNPYLTQTYEEALAVAR